VDGAASPPISALPSSASHYIFANPSSWLGLVSQTKASPLGPCYSSSVAGLHLRTSSMRANRKIAKGGIAFSTSIARFRGMANGKCMCRIDFERGMGRLVVEHDVAFYL
jgi:hypothetical protein